MIERTRGDSEVNYDEGSVENGGIVALVVMAVGDDLGRSKVRVACYLDTIIVPLLWS